MELLETLYFCEEPDVRRKLAAMELDIDGLSFVAEVAISAAAEATAYHPANCAGTLAYHHGTWALRDRFVSDRWSLDRQDSVELIVNDYTMTKIVYCNVHLARHKEILPQPRSPKGVGSERAVNGYQLSLDIPKLPVRIEEEYATYYLMVDEFGSSELSRPIIRGGKFPEFIERIWLREGDSLADLERVKIDDDDAVEEFDPVVERK